MKRILAGVAAILIAIHPAHAQYHVLDCIQIDLSARPLPDNVREFGPWEAQRLLDALTDIAALPPMANVETAYALILGDGRVLVLAMSAGMACMSVPVPMAMFEAALRMIRGDEI